jgi:hypothetical protein
MKATPADSTVSPLSGDGFDTYTQIGAYSTSPLPANSQFDIVVEADGFVPQRLSNVYLTAGQATARDFELAVCNTPPKAAPQNTPVVLVRGFGADTEWIDDDSKSWEGMRW